VTRRNKTPLRLTNSRDAVPRAHRADKVDELIRLMGGYTSQDVDANLSRIGNSTV